MKANGSITNKGVTVLELMVAVAILAVLVALIDPMIQSARHATNQTTCVSNLKRLGAAGLMYSQENNNEILFSISLLKGSAAAWDKLLYPYVNVTRPAAGQRPTGIFACPASTKLTTEAFASDYGKNYFLNYSTITLPSSGHRFRLTDLANPGAYLFFADAAGRDVNTNSIPEPRHRKYANAVYFDGHVEAVNPERLPTSSALPPWKP